MLAALDLVGAVLKWLALAFAAPVAVALANGESPLPFLITGLAVGMIGLGFDRLTPDRAGLSLGPREGFLVVAVLWMLIPLRRAAVHARRGAAAERPVDAYFEAMSGFTATGATVLAQSRPGPDMLFWRQLSHWLGGMGIIVLAIGDAASAAGRRPAVAAVRASGTDARSSSSAPPCANGPAPVEALRGRERRRDLALAVLGWTRPRSGDDPLRAFSFASLGGRARRLRAQISSPRASGADDAVGSSRR